MTMNISVKGVSGVRKMLAPFLEPELTRELQEATKQGAKVLRAPLRSALSGVSKRMAGAISIRKAKRGRPATIVGSKRKKAFFWHMVIGGTKEHGPRTARYMVIGLNAARGTAATVRARKTGSGLIQGPGAMRGRGFRLVRHVRGVPPNPIIDEVATANQSRVIAAMNAHIARRR